MEFHMQSISTDDRKAVIDIFNYYIANSFAAYPQAQVPYEAFERFLMMSKGYPNATVKTANDEIVGFGFLHAFNPLSTFAATAEITYFIHPDYTGKGIGKQLLDLFEKQAVQQGIKNILANISSLNPGSINFHKKNGFVECGRMQNIISKNDQTFDIVWLQKML